MHWLLALLVITAQIEQVTAMDLASAPDLPGQLAAMSPGEYQGFVWQLMRQARNEMTTGLVLTSLSNLGVDVGDFCREANRLGRSQSGSPDQALRLRVCR